MSDTELAEMPATEESVQVHDGPVEVGGQAETKNTTDNLAVLV